MLQFFKRLIMSYNPTKDHGRNAATTDSIQQRIAGIEDRYHMAILGGRDENGNILDQDELRHQMFMMKALLGQVRVRAQEVVQEMKSELEARKGLLELAKA
jgi:hypothetical protein